MIFQECRLLPQPKCGSSLMLDVRYIDARSVLAKLDGIHCMGITNDYMYQLSAIVPS